MEIKVAVGANCPVGQAIFIAKLLLHQGHFLRQKSDGSLPAPFNSITDFVRGRGLVV
jgi:hypothetical protein